MKLVLLVALTLALIALAFSINQWREARKRRREIRTGFGKPPREANGRLPGQLFWESYHGALHPAYCIDDTTWQDLDMDSVFLRLNACQSRVGDIWLYTRLRLPPREPEAALAAREELIGAMYGDAALREKLALTLATLGRRGTAALEMPAFHPETLMPGRRGIYRLLAFMPLLALPILFTSPMWALAVFGLLSAINFTVYHYIRSRNEDRVKSMGYLIQLLRTADKLAKAAAPSQPEVAARLGAATKPFGFLRRSYLVLVLDEALATFGVPNPLAFFQLPLLSLCKMAARLKGHREDVLALYEAIGEVDLAYCVLSYRESLPLACKPVFTGEAGFEAGELYHPLLDEPVANNAAFPRGALFTGSNASGKSTFLKAVAINALCAQTLNTCCASSLRLRPGPVASSMAASDNVVEGDSYFVAEIKSIRRLVELADSGQYAYLFIDEILRGTNTVERVAAATSLLRYLAEGPCLPFAATHDIELTALLADAYDNYHFRESVQAGAVTFDYLLKQGPATSRNAILLLEGMGFPAAVTAGARTLAAGFESTGLWKP